MNLTNTWQFFTDQVMGGVSSDQFRYHEEGDKLFIRITEVVSTKNRSGFTQMDKNYHYYLANGLKVLIMRP